MQEKEAVRQCFITYLTDAKIKEEIAQRIIKISQVFAKVHQQKEFIKMFFEQKSFVTMGKRFLYIIHQLLERDSKKEKQERYSPLLSQSIVEYYLFFFTNIFKYSSLRDLIIELKMYRMKWAKRITDEAFFGLRDQINKKFKFNLQKGFPQQNLDKIKKLYEKREFTNEQTNRYLGLNISSNQDIKNKKQIQNQAEGRKIYLSSEQSDSNSNNSSSPKKKIKPNQNMNGKNNLKPSIQNLNSSYGMQYGRYPQPQVYDPAFSGYHISPNQSFNPIVNQVPFFHQASYQKKQYDYNPPQQQRPHSHQRQQPINISQTQVQSNNHQNYYKQNPKEIIYAPTSSYTIPNYIFHDLKPTFKQDKRIQLLQKLKKNLVSCRQCGILFQNQENYQGHLQRHFFQSLQKFNPQTLPKNTKQKDDRFKLLDINTWLNSDKNQQTQFYFQVPIEPEFENVKTCYFCNENLEISWSQRNSKWAFRNCGTKKVMHYQCYQGFQSQGNSHTSSENNQKNNEISSVHN